MGSYVSLNLDVHNRKVLQLHNSKEEWVSRKPTGCQKGFPSSWKWSVLSLYSGLYPVHILFSLPGLPYQSMEWGGEAISSVLPPHPDAAVSQGESRQCKMSIAM